jgi:tetratricopeptide (TPR) repeat protein
MAHAPTTRLSRTTLTAVALLLAAFLIATAVDLARGRLAASPRAGLGPVPAVLDRLDVLRGRVASRPNDAAAYRDLGVHYLRRARETADPTYYGKADGALVEARRLNPDDPDTLIGFGTLALARHQFAEAQGWGEQARALAPRKAAAYGVIGDAQVELGRYDDAIETIQRMVDLKPDLASYARVSYLRELQGDLPGAIAAMELAARAGATAGEQGAWTRVQLGHLLLRTGRVDEAEREYRWVLAMLPDDPLATAGLGRARLTVGDYAGAIPLYRRAAERLPSPELVLALADLYEATGQPADAVAQLAVARALQQLAAASGGNVDMELALFEADHGDAFRAVELARSEVERRASIHAYDALAWALFRAGDLAGASEASRQALRMGTRDGLMLFHAGLIDLALGESEAARDALRRALAADPGFSARYVPEARRLLSQLEVTQ